jgi:hypothetical protein
MLSKRCEVALVSLKSAKRFKSQLFDDMMNEEQRFMLHQMVPIHRVKHGGGVLVPTSWQFLRRTVFSTGNDAQLPLLLALLAHAVFSPYLDYFFRETIFFLFSLGARAGALVQTSRADCLPPVLHSATLDLPKVASQRGTRIVSDTNTDCCYVLLSRKRFPCILNLVQPEY